MLWARCKADLLESSDRNTYISNKHSYASVTVSSHSYTNRCVSYTVSREHFINNLEGNGIGFLLTTVK